MHNDTDFLYSSMPENRYNPTTLTNMENSLLNQLIRIRSCLIDSAHHTTAIAEGATIYPSETYQKNGSLRIFRSKSTSIKKFLLSVSMLKGLGMVTTWEHLML